MATETDLIAAMADAKLAQFDGHDVVRATMAVVGAGDGLSKAMALAPMEIPQGTEVTIVIRGIVDEVSYKPIAKDTPGLLGRKHKIIAGVATFLDNALVAKALDEQAEKIRVATEKAKGIARLTDADGTDVVGEAEKADKATKRTRRAAPADPGVTQSGEFKSEAFDPVTAAAKATRRRTPAAPKAPVQKLVSVPDLPAPDGEQTDGAKVSEHG